MQTVEYIGKGKESNISILEQLEAMREALNTIEERIEPTPAKYPDSFEQAKIFLAPYVLHGQAFYKECLSFRSKIDEYMMDLRRVHLSLPSKGNAMAWRKTFEALEDYFDDQCHALMGQVTALGNYYLHAMHMAAMACECDFVAMNTALLDTQAEQEGACHE